MPTISATKSIPAVYRHILLTIEPLMAMGGVIIATAKPSRYTEMMTRNAVPFTPGSEFIYTQVAGSWLYFAFIEAVVLRMYDDLGLWRLLCLGMLLSDTWFCIGTVQGAGGLASWATLAEWTQEDWATFLSTVPPALVRIFMVLGVGIKRVDSPSTKPKRK